LVGKGVGVPLLPEWMIVVHLLLFVILLLHCDMGWLLFIVEAPIPDQDPIANLYGTKKSIKLGLNFNQVMNNTQNYRRHIFLVLNLKSYTLNPIHLVPKRPSATRAIPNQSWIMTTILDTTLCPDYNVSI
jgi:hypothetical protein